MQQSDFSWWSFIKTILIAFGIVFIVRHFLFSPIVVEGPSMEPTLTNRDYMLVNKVKYRFQNIDRFDIVVFHATEDKDYIKRVIGLPGEHIAYEDNVLYVDGKPIEESFLKGNEEILTEDFILQEIPGGYKKIPENYVFVLGDNRMDSTDSRTIGLVEIDDIVGKTNIRYWPLNRIQLF